MLIPIPSQARGEAATLVVAVQATPVPDAPIVRSLAEGAAAALRSAGAAGACGHAHGQAARGGACAGLACSMQSSCLRVSAGCAAWL